MSKTFEELGIEDKILKAIKEQGFETPMPVQEEVIPHLLNDDTHDIVALAQTGTGKTAAFGLPIIQNVDSSGKQTQYLILSPTRELCLQIADDLSGYAKYKTDIKIAAVFGGASIDRQIQMLRKGAHIISATPGRLLDMIHRKVVKLDKIRTIVLDEADEMLNMGFREDLESILSETPSGKNTLLFSATMPREVATIANRYMKKPIEITIGKRNAGAENVNHIAYLVQSKDRYLALKRIVDFHPDIYGIIFCRTRMETQEVAESLMKDGYDAEPLHGDLTQIQRDKVMGKFRIRNVSLLVATDVAARGLDVDDLTHIINYNFPEELEIYTHRSGRTGRAGKAGTSIMISSTREKHKLAQIEKKLGKQFSILPIPGGREICEKQLFHLIDKMEKVEVDDLKINSFLPAIYKKLEWLDREELIKKFVSVEFNRFLDYYQNAPELSVKMDGKGSRGQSDTEYTRFFINLGEMDDIKPQNLIGLINDFTDIRTIEIGQIEILRNFSFFEVDSDFKEVILNSFQGQVYKKREVVVELAAGKSKSSGRGAKKKRGSFSSQKRDIKFSFAKKKNKKDRDRNRHR